MVVNLSGRGDKDLDSVREFDAEHARPERKGKAVHG
jgi:tryptophan synthase beta subunit